MMNSKKIWMLLAMALPVSCAREHKGMASASETVYPAELSPREFVSWNKSETRLKEHADFEDMSFNITYHPAEWMALQDLGPEASAAQIKQEAENYTDLLYFSLRIALKNQSTELLKFGAVNQQQYQQRVNYYSFGIQHDITLVSGADTLPCSIAHFERVYNVTNYTDIMIGFSREALNRFKPGWESVTLLFNDRIFGHGNIPFRFNKTQLSNTPKLKVS